MAYQNPLAFPLGLEGVGGPDRHGRRVPGPVVHVRRAGQRADRRGGAGGPPHPRRPAGRRRTGRRCGTGRHTEYLAARGHRVTGVDSSPDMLGRAPTRVPDAVLLSGDLHDLPLPDDAFGLVVCCLALTHVAELAPVMAEFVRVRRPGGHLVTSDIHVLSMYLGGLASVPGPDGRSAMLPANRHLAGDYLAAAVPLGLQVWQCVEPCWPASDSAGGSLARQFCPAADAAHAAAPAAIVWHFMYPASRQ